MISIKHSTKKLFMKIKTIRYIIILLLLNTFLFSSTISISGQVADKKTKINLSNVNVFIKNTDFGTITNKNGYFNFNLIRPKENNLKLTIQMIGYEKKEISLDLSKNNIDLGEIFLKVKAIELETIDIHSHNKPSNQISDIIIEGHELNKSLKGNIASTLAHHPNIGINAFGSVTSKPSLRGFSGDRFLLTKDGIGTGDLSQSSIDHAISLDMTEVNQIEIIRGPKSLVYGPNAIGGVVNTKLLGSPTLRVYKFHQKYLIGSESFNNARYGNLMFYIPMKNNQLNLFYSKRNTQEETTPIGRLENTKSNINNYKLGFTNYNQYNYVNLIVERFNMNYGIPPTSIGHIDGVDIFLLKDSYQINYHQDILISSFSQFDLKYNFIDYIHLEKVNDATQNNNIFELIDSKQYHVALAKETNNLKIELSSDKSIMGLEYDMKNFKPDGFYLTPTTNETEISIYGFNEKHIKNLDIELLSSFRLSNLWVKPEEDKYTNRNRNLILKDEDGNPILDENGSEISLVRDREFKNISLSIGINKHINKFKFNSWLMYTMRPPRVEELFSDGPHLASYAFEIGNPNLKSENIYGLENSISYNSYPLDFSLVTFYNYSPYYFEMTKNGHCEVPEDWQPWTTHPCHGVDWIDWGSGGLGWLHKYSAKGNKVIIKGFEFDLGYKLKNFKIRYNFSFVQGDNKTIKKPLSYMNPTKQILNFDFDYHIMSYKIRFSKIHSQNRLGEFETYTPGAFLTDFIITFDYKKHNMIIQLNNIFDEKYYNHLSRIKDITPEPGKNFHLIYKLFI